MTRCHVNRSRHFSAKAIGLVVGLVAVTTAAIAQNVVQVTATNPILVGGLTAQCAVRIDTTAPVGGTVVNLYHDTIKIEVPDTVVVPEGRRNAFFHAKTQTVLAESTGTISASIGSSTQYLTLTLLTGGLTDGYVDPEIASGGTGSGYVWLSGVAGAGGVSVELLAKDPTVLTVPANVLVPEGLVDSEDFDVVAAVVAVDTLTAVRARYVNSIRLMPVTVRLLNPTLTINVKKLNGTPRNNAVVTVTYSDLTTETVVTGPSGVALFTFVVPGAASFTVVSPRGAWGPVSIVVDPFDPTVVPFTET